VTSSPWMQAIPITPSLIKKTKTNVSGERNILYVRFILQGTVVHFNTTPTKIKRKENLEHQLCIQIVTAVDE